MLVTWLNLRAPMCPPHSGTEDRSLPGVSCLCYGHTQLENVAELGSVRCKSGNLGA